jgi:hypothetical protein
MNTFWDRWDTLVIVVWLAMVATVIFFALANTPETEAGWCRVEERRVTYDCVGGEMMACYVTCNPVARGNGSFECQCVSDCWSIGRCEDNV